jgi:hypothetical protein
MLSTASVDVYLLFSMSGRQVLFLSANPDSWEFQPENTLKLRPWKKDITDTTLLDLIPMLQVGQTLRHPVHRNAPCGDALLQRPHQPVIMLALDCCCCDHAVQLIATKNVGDVRDVVK